MPPSAASSSDSVGESALTPVKKLRTVERAGRPYLLWQAQPELGHPPGRAVHLTDGQAEPVPEKPDPLPEGPGHQLFGALYLVRGGVGMVHGSSVPFRRPGGGRRPRSWRRARWSREGTVGVGGPMMVAIAV